MEKNEVMIPVQGMDFTHVDVKVVYDKGEYRTPRGYYVRITGVADCPGLNIVQWSSDWPYEKYLVERVERKSAKAFRALAEKVLNNAQEIADRFIKKDYEGIWALL